MRPYKLFCDVARYTIVLVAVVAGGASAQAAKDPCDVAIGPAQTCSGESCALDPATSLDGPWQRVGACIRPLRDIWKRQGPQAMVDAGDGKAPVADVVRNTVYRAMTQSGAGAALARDPSRYVPLAQVINPDLTLKAPIVRIAQLNDRGLPYSSMSQSGIARILYAFAGLADQSAYPQAKADRDAYVQLGNASIQTVLTPVGDGGLATTGPCAGAPQLTCSWYHAVTRKDLVTTEGATLNKNLHAIRDMILIEAHLRRNNWPDNPALEAGVAAGLNQLFLSDGHIAAGRPPNFADFLATPGGGPSWAYYGLNPAQTPPRGGYFLKERGRNCHYHYHVLDLMAVILKRTDKADVAPEARSKALACSSPLRQMYLAATDNLPAPAAASSATVPQQWCAGSPGKEVKKRIRFLSKAFSNCPG